MAGKPRVPRGPDEPHDLNVTGLTEREVAALADIARRRTEAARSTGAVITRNALIVATLRSLIASEGAQ